MAHISVVVPVFKAADCLEELYRQLCQSLEAISGDFEIILVEDGSGDGSWSVILELAKRDRRVKGIRFSRNFGQHYAITAGLDICDADWVVIMDCDLQDQPKEIPKLYAKAKEGYHVVTAKRIRRRDAPLKQLLSSVFYSLFRYLADMDYDGQIGNFRIISRKVVGQYRQMHEKLRFFGGLIHWMGFPTASVEVEHGLRYKGKSTYSLPKLLKLATETVIAYSDKPLRLCICFGFLLSAVAFGFGIVILAHALFYHSPVMGWASLIVSMHFLSGIIIVILGIIGIYLGKTFDENKKRPLYVVLDDTFTLG